MATFLILYDLSRQVRLLHNDEILLSPAQSPQECKCKAKKSKTKADLELASSSPEINISSAFLGKLIHKV